jgi:hypothetical protein
MTETSPYGWSPSSASPILRNASVGGLHNGGANGFAVRQIIDNLFCPPPPRMIFAHERPGRTLSVGVGEIFLKTSPIHLAARLYTRQHLVSHGGPRDRRSCDEKDEDQSEAAAATHRRRTLG